MGVGRFLLEPQNSYVSDNIIHPVISATASETTSEKIAFLAIFSKDSPLQSLEGRLLPDDLNSRIRSVGHSRATKNREIAIV